MDSFWQEMQSYGDIRSWKLCSHIFIMELASDARPVCHNTVFICGHSYCPRGCMYVLWEWEFLCKRAHLVHREGIIGRESHEYQSVVGMARTHNICNRNSWTQYMSRHRTVSLMLWLTTCLIQLTVEVCRATRERWSGIKCSNPPNFTEGVWGPLYSMPEV